MVRAPRDVADSGERGRERHPVNLPRATHTPGRGALNPAQARGIEHRKQLFCPRCSPRRAPLPLGARISSSRRRSAALVLLLARSRMICVTTICVTAISTDVPTRGEQSPGGQDPGPGERRRGEDGEVRVPPKLAPRVVPVGSFPCRAATGSQRGHRDTRIQALLPRLLPAHRLARLPVVDPRRPR